MGESDKQFSFDAPACADGGPMLVCRAATMLCAFPLGQISEIMRALPVEELAGAPPFVLGAAVVRGRPVPVVDVGLLIGGHPHPPESPPGWMVGLRLGTGAVALAVHAILGVETLPPGIVHGLPPLLQDAAIEAISAIGTLDSELLLFLNIARCLPPGLMAPAAEGPPS